MFTKLSVRLTAYSRHNSLQRDLVQQRATALKRLREARGEAEVR